MYTDIRLGSLYQNRGGGNFLSHPNGKNEGKKIDSRNNSSSSFSTSEKATTAEDFSDHPENNFSDRDSVAGDEPQKEDLFLNREIQQVETSSRACNILKAGYRNSNRGAVALGLAGGIVGGIHGGPSGASFGMTVGSSLGAHLGGLSGLIGECTTLPRRDGMEAIVPEQSSHDIAESNHFLGHVIQVVDQAGHHAAVGSIAVGVGTLLASLVTGNPLPVALHTAGVYSGSVWAFGLTTGSAHWLRQHLQRSEEILQNEQKTSPGDVELTPLKVLETKS